jgi:aquaporin Z
MPLGRKLVVEFIGTFFLVFTVCTATNPQHGAGVLAPLAIGAVLMVMVFAGGHISGAHYNPAVSTAVLIRGKMTSAEYWPYILTQLLAGVIAALIARAVNGGGHAGTFAGGGKMLIVEFLFTFALAYVVLNVATARGTEGNSFYGLAIGFTVTAGAFAVGGLSGGAFNPAVALGALVLGIFKWSNVWVYLIGPLLGGAAAAAVFLYVQPAEKPEGDIEAARAGQAPGGEL